MEQLFLPNTVEELIELLDKQFPEKCADITETERRIFMRSGHREVVRWLLDLKARTEELRLASSMEK